MRHRQSPRVTHACVDYMSICASTSHANAPASLPLCHATRPSFSSARHMNLIDPLHLSRPNIKSVPSPSTWTTGLDPIHSQPTFNPSDPSLQAQPGSAKKANWIEVNQNRVELGLAMEANQVSPFMGPTSTWSNQVHGLQPIHGPKAITTSCSFRLDTATRSHS